MLVLGWAHRRVTLRPTLAVQVQVWKGIDRRKPSGIVVAGDRAIAPASHQTLERHLARPVGPAARIGSARQGLVAVDHGHEAPLRPRHGSQPRRRARHWKAQGMEAACDSLTSAFKEEHVVELLAQAWQALVERPGNDRWLEGHEHRRARTTCQ